MSSAHIDTFARDNLPPPEQQPQFVFDLPELQFPEQLNCATELLDRHVTGGRGDRVCIRAPNLSWTYADLQDKANRIANVLLQDMGVLPGNRVLLHAPNNAMMAACWFAVMKVGAIAVATMPLLRAKELTAVIDKAQIRHALCDAALATEMHNAALQCVGLKTIRHFNYAGPDSLEAAMSRQSGLFNNANTAADDTCIIAFTSGTTGIPKATMHFHRDVMAVCAGWPRHVLKATADDVFIGSPPLAFTFGLGGLILFPMSVGASTVLLEKAGPAQLLDGIREFGATVLFTAPTSYRTLAPRGVELRKTALRRCISAGEALPVATRTLWRDATGIELIDGIGATELLHIFISADEAHARPGATGKVVPGYQARVVDDQGAPVPPGTVGKLAVRGPTGCRYLADDRQTAYVRDGWNFTGDAYRMDADGYFFYQARTDDMIVSSGYNIAAPDVEDALMLHPAVAECAVIGCPDAERGQIVQAFIVLRQGHDGSDTMARELQDFVKNAIAPYKYPRSIRFVSMLPRTQTGKLQRFKLRDLA
jgi:2-aminobenzoate-CoA ligase